MDEPVTQEIGTPGQLGALYAALAAAQGEFLPIVKNREVSIDIKNKQTGAKAGSYKFRYADLEEVTSKTRPALSKHKLATMQPIVKRGNQSILVTRLVHADGGMIVSEIDLPPSGGDVKNFGAAISYLRRYAKTSLLDVAADDDLDEDGQAAGEQSQPQSRPEQRTGNATPTAEAAQGPYCPDLFAKNLPKWAAGVRDGKTTPERIIQMASTRGVLSAEQVKQIHEAAAAEEATV